MVRHSARAKSSHGVHPPRSARRHIERVTIEQRMPVTQVGEAARAVG
jgi:hypothetical protein